MLGAYLGITIGMYVVYVILSAVLLMVFVGDVLDRSRPPATGRQALRVTALWLLGGAGILLWPLLPIPCLIVCTLIAIGKTPGFSHYKT